MAYSQLQDVLSACVNPDRKEQMERYMRNQFIFLGVATPQRRSATKGLLRMLCKESSINWEFVDACWSSPEREYQYVAVDYLWQAREMLQPSDLLQLRRLIETKSWWDTVDTFFVVVGSLVERFPHLKSDMLSWSLDNHLWVRRVAICFQLKFKTNTDTDLLRQVILNNAEHNDFFIRKAIGWILREYSKTNPVWVSEFITQYGERLSNLSIREGYKYIK